MLASNCALLRVSCSFDRLYSGADPDYALMLGAVVSRVSEHHRERNAKEEAAAKAAR